MEKTQKQFMFWGAVWLAGLTFLAVVIPGLLVRRSPADTSQKRPASIQKHADGIEKESPVMIPVYLSKQQKVETVPLEEYVKGVVAAEMPAEFELEAMKAQALAARTYMVRRILEQDFSNVPVKDAWVTDTISHQAYITEEELKKKWTPAEYAANMDKINRAVEETKGLILTYDHKPINATFFSTSNGYTENSEDYWGIYTPYLRSVPSPWDVKLAPRYKETTTFGYQDVLQKLGVSSISASSGRSTSIKVLAWSTGHRIEKISIGGKTFTGREVREKLNLNSSQFDWRWKGNQLEITTYGNGHGVGMSQWGANGMAKEGKTAEEIVKYYYKGISIEKASI
jgi:stage II sporulation protein D